MKAFVIAEPWRFEFREVAEPALGEEDVLIEVRRVGLCGTDLATYRGRGTMVSYPRIPGHEIGGIVVGKGAGVPDAIREGMNVAVMPCTNCGDCTACRLGRENACRDNQTLGVQCEGALTERIAAHFSKVFPSAKLGARELAFAEPMAVAWHATERGRVAEGDTAVVLGCGGIGSGAVAACVAKGARVISVEIDPRKAELARRIGAETAVNANEEDVAARITDLTGGHGADVVIEAVGKPETFRQAVDLVCHCGRIVYIGYCKESVTFETTLFVGKELDILGARNAQRRDFPPVVGLLEEGCYPVEDMLTRTFAFDDAGDALHFWHENQADVRRLQVELG